MTDNKKPLKILYLFDAVDWTSRVPLVDAAHAQGHDVAIGLIGDKRHETRNNLPYKRFSIRKPPGRFSVFAVMGLIKNIQSTIQNDAPDMVHAVTLKYAFFTGIALRKNTKIQRIYTIAGLGYLFRSSGWKPKVIKTLLKPFLKMALRNSCTTLIFQNPDDRIFLLREGLAESEKSFLIRGSGVDLERFKAAPPPDDACPLVLMPTRLVKEKGIDIFIQAAEILTKMGVKARFHIAGGETRHNPQAISKTEMDAMVNASNGAAEWLGRIDDMPELLSRSALIVYPSSYGEGVPRVLLEALAAGRPIVTTDHPGCKETVDEGQNGFLVPINDAGAVAKAIEKILSDKKLRHIMGVHSRKKAENEFAIEKIIAETLSVYNQ